MAVGSLGSTSSFMSEAGADSLSLDGGADRDRGGGVGGMAAVKFCENNPANWVCESGEPGE